MASAFSLESQIKFPLCQFYASNPIHWLSSRLQTILSLNKNVFLPLAFMYVAVQIWLSKHNLIGYHKPIRTLNLKKTLKTPTLLLTDKPLNLYTPLERFLKKVQVLHS